MSKGRYLWWPYVRGVVRAYPERKGEGLHGVAMREQEAVQAAIEATERMSGGAERLKVIRMVHWDRVHTLDGAALAVPCDRATAARWQRKFFEAVARNRDLLD